MAEGLSAALAAEILNALGNAASLSILPVTTFYIQLHTAAPGAAGTTAVAGNATRKSVSFSSTSDGTLTNDADISWSTSEVDTSEDYTHWSAWDASTSGNFLCSGAVTANAVTSGDEFKIPTGELDLGFNVATSA